MEAIALKQGELKRDISYDLKKNPNAEVAVIP